MSLLKNIVNLFKKKRALMSSEDFRKAIEEGGQLMDVRMITEYRKGHIPGAYHNDMYLDEFLDNCESKYDKDLPLYIYCRSGKRSQVAAQKLRNIGFKAVIELEGGYVNYN